MIACMGRRDVPFIVALSLSLVAVAAALVVTDDPSLRALYAARWTARAMFLIFLIIYLAAPLNRLVRSPATQVVLHRRRQWGLAFAAAMTVHLAALSINIIMFRPREPSSLVGGAVAYALAYIMALTSTNHAQRRFGRWWNGLHRFGLHYIWFIFLVSYGSRIFHKNPQYHASGWVLTAAVLGALAVRLMAARRRQLPA